MVSAKRSAPWLKNEGWLRQNRSLLKKEEGKGFELFHLATPILQNSVAIIVSAEDRRKGVFCLIVGFLSMNSLFFDKGGDKFSTDSSVFSTNVSRVLQGWKEGDNFAAEKGIRDLKGSGI